MNLQLLIIVNQFCIEKLIFEKQYNKRVYFLIALVT